MRQNPRPLSAQAFTRLRNDLPRLTERLSDDQLLTLTSELHDLMKARRQWRIESGLTHVHPGLNDNRPLPRRPNDRPWFWAVQPGSEADLFSQF
jgi:hypothetical protein